ncbi:MAG: RnfABCDGE type electron transport complex subunit G [Bacteroidaceae bacterium]|nr:RnfABCDGE type electron transport complex subunit G [Bacteroidaceae bacterium]
MKKLESNIFNMAVVLTVISIVSAGLLALVNGVTSGPIAEINGKTVSDGVKNVVIGDGNVDFMVLPPQEKNGFVFHKVTDASGNILGTAVESTDPNGFGGNLKIMVGFDPEGEILGYQVLEHSETPGLGAQADAWFRQASGGEVREQSAFANVVLGAPAKAGNHNIIGMNPGDDLMWVSKEGGDVDAITASTITSKAFMRAVNAAYKSLFGYSAADAVSSASAQTKNKK